MPREVHHLDTRPRQLLIPHAGGLDRVRKADSPLAGRQKASHTRLAVVRDAVVPATRDPGEVAPLPQQDGVQTPQVQEFGQKRLLGADLVLVGGRQGHIAALPEAAVFGKAQPAEQGRLPGMQPNGLSGV